MLFLFFWCPFRDDRCPPAKSNHSSGLVGQQHDRLGGSGLQHALLGHPQFPVEVGEKEKKGVEEEEEKENASIRSHRWPLCLGFCRTRGGNEEQFYRGAV